MYNKKSKEHCTGIAEVVGSNPAQSLNFFQVSVLVVSREFVYDFCFLHVRRHKM